MDGIEKQLGKIFSLDELTQFTRASQSFDLLHETIEKLTAEHTEFYQRLCQLSQEIKMADNKLKEQRHNRETVSRLIDKHYIEHEFRYVLQGGEDASDTIDSMSSQLDVSNRKTKRSDELLVKYRFDVNGKATQDEFQKVEAIISKLEKDSPKIDELAASLSREIEEEGKTELEDLKSLVAQESRNLRECMDNMGDNTELPQFVTEEELHEFVVMLSTVPNTKKCLITSVVPSVLEGKGTMEEKLSSIAEALGIKRPKKGINVGCVDEDYQFLKFLAEESITRMGYTYEGYEAETRDACTDCGFVEVSAPRTQVLVRVSEQRTVWTQFLPPTRATFGVEVTSEELTEKLEEKPEKELDTSAITKEVLKEVEDQMKTSIEQYMSKAGTNIEPETIKGLVRGLKTMGDSKDILSDIRTETQRLMDKANFMEEINKKAKKEDLYALLGMKFVPTRQNKRTTIHLPAIRSPAKRDTVNFERREEPPRQKRLVPAYNPKMLAVNKKYMVGSDGKLYLRDMGTESRPHSHLVAMESVFDHQPFIEAPE